MHLLGGAGQVHFLKQCLVVRVIGRPPVLLVENSGIVALNSISLGVVLPVAGDLVDEKEGQHLDALGAQTPLLVEMLPDRAADHLALYSERVHITPRLAGLEVLLAARCAQLDILVSLGYPDLADAAIRIDGPPGGLLQVVAILYRDFLALDPASPKISAVSA